MNVTPTDMEKTMTTTKTKITNFTLSLVLLHVLTNYSVIAWNTYTCIYNPHRFLVPSSSSYDSSRLDIRKSSSSSTSVLYSNLDRRSALSHSSHNAGILALLMIGSNGKVVQAATPTFDDYEATMNGAKIVQEAQSTVSDDIIRDLGLRVKLTTKADLIAFTSKLEQSLTALQVLVDNADWASVRSVLRGEGPQFEGNVLSICRKPFFGIKGERKGIMKALSMSEEDVSALEDAREDFSFTLAELEDFALENRSIYFNSLDRKQVDELISETGFKENKDEGKSLLTAAKKGSFSFSQLVKKL